MKLRCTTGHGTALAAGSGHCCPNSVVGAVFLSTLWREKKTGRAARARANTHNRTVAGRCCATRATPINILDYFETGLPLTQYDISCYYFGVPAGPLESVPLGYDTVFRAVGENIEGAVTAPPWNDRPNFSRSK